MYYQMFSYRQYALELLWVCDMADTDGLRHAFRIITPEESLVVYCTSARDKAMWMQSLHVAVCRFIVHFDTGIEQAIMGGALSPRPQPLADVVAKYTISQLERRRVEFVFIMSFFFCQSIYSYVSFMFRTHIVYREAKYAGEWVLGRPEGQGKVICADGREYTGNFKDGLCEGYAELTSPVVSDI
jgi:hypothetical protein